jgi:hypothetical protein
MNAMTVRRLMLLPLMPALGLLATAPAFAEVRLTAPGVLSKAGETYRLTTDITSPGTAFRITAANIVLDLNGFTIKYNETDAAVSHGVQVTAANVRITNGRIVQGARNTTAAHAIDITGAQPRLDRLDIRVSGEDTYGVRAGSADGAVIQQLFIASSAASNSTGDPPVGIEISSVQGGLDIHDNVIVGSVRGIQLTYIGLRLFPQMPTKSRVYRNLLQPDRIYGSKAPYGILVARSSNIDVHDNQIFSDQGRGINLDGYGQNAASGTTRIDVRRNLIDVQYSPNPRVGGGGYPDNDVYGIRDRYHSGDNTIADNTILVDSTAGRDNFGLFIGSDAADPDMKNILVTNNVLVSRDTDAAGTANCIQTDYAVSITIQGNRYSCADAFVPGTGLFGSTNVTNLVVTDNTALPMPTTAPAAPAGLRARRFGDRILLEWDAVSSPQTYEYRVYRDGQRISRSDVGVRFFIDTVATGTPSYTVSAVNLAGMEGPQGAALRSTAATAGWRVPGQAPPPSPPRALVVR